MTDHQKIVLAGQPNCGKSTIFNEVSGYRSFSSNFPGATVEYTESHVNICGQTFDIIDLPGIYSLTSLDPAAQESQRYLLTMPVDAIINVVDASTLGRSLELTLQLLDLEIPMILCLNMMDEAMRKGIQIDMTLLSSMLGVPVFPTVANRGSGVQELFQHTLKSIEKPRKGRHLRGSRDVEQIITSLSRCVVQQIPAMLPATPRLIATKLLQNDPYFEKMILKNHPNFIHEIRTHRKELTFTHGKKADEVINGERHAIAMSLFEKVTVIKKPKVQFKDRADQVLMHPVWGMFFLIFILFSFYQFVFRVGGIWESSLLKFSEMWSERLIGLLPSDSFFQLVFGSILDGIIAGLAVVLPYLLPFFIGLAILEDIGYLPRVAFLMDRFMHRIGLHGTAVIPAILGYGCNVPAVMATRILESPRDRFIAAFISTLVPCAAKMTIIFGLVGATMGGTIAFGIYFVNLGVITLTGHVLSRILPEDTPGMILEIPAYHRPQPKTVLIKTWMRMKEFIVVAWPFLIAGSVILTLIQHFHWVQAVNRGLYPITTLLGLPAETGMTLIFGVLRKELSMLMLFQAMGTHDLSTVMSNGQILVFTVFVVFYVPCAGTIGALKREINTKKTLIIVIATFFMALILGIITRGIMALI